MRITEEIAKDVIDRMCPVIGRDISITDDRGIVVGSSDPQWVGKSYKEAIATINEGKITEVDTEDGVGGTNFPIFLGDRVIGVLWITGRGRHVRDIGRITSVTIELLLHRRFIETVGSLKTHAMSSFVRSLLKKDSFDWEDMASYLSVLGYDPSLPRFAVALGIPKYGAVIGSAIGVMEKSVSGGMVRYDVREKVLSTCKKIPQIGDQDILTNINGGLFAIFKVGSTYNSEEEAENRKIEWSFRLSSVLKEEIKEDVFLGIGPCAHSISMLKKSFREAVRALEVGILLSEFAGKNVFFYDEPIVLLGNLIRSSGEDERRSFASHAIGNINQSKMRKEILHTLKTYLSCGMNASSAAKKLFIHKNTLLYRLDRIKRLTGLDPHNPIDAFYLWLALQVVSMGDVLYAQ